MPDYIHRKTVLDTIRRNAMLRVQDIYDAVESLPAVNMGSERGESAEWQYVGNPMEWEGYICSGCNTLSDEVSNFCPYCGARMRMTTDAPSKTYDFLYEEGGVNDG